MNFGPIRAASTNQIIDQTNETGVQSEFALEVRAGLSSPVKTLPPKYFYDPLGSQLFEAICLLPEYYLTRAETSILERHAAEIVDQLPGAIGLVELGSGSSIKTRLLIEALLERQRELDYQPLDISATIIEQSSSKLLGDYPQLKITARVCDYTRGLGELDRRRGERILALFLGSNIGNYQPSAALGLLRLIRKSLGPGDGLLLGADLKKARQVLEQAYHDRLGVTAAFNLNLLARINRELGADFDLKQFEHRAIYDDREGRIEMHLVSRQAQTVLIPDPDLRIDFRAGESIHTESSYKYDLRQLTEMARSTGFQSARIWTDEEERFSCNFWRAV